MEPVSAFGVVWEILHWRVALDIALIAVGFFLLYHTLRATGTWKIVVGVLIAAAVFAAASLLGLRGIEWIFSNLSGVALLGLIVVFQPEIRRILERTASMRGGGTGTRQEGVANLIAEATWTLANQRRGALLVFPGKEAVQPWISGGVRVDAVPSLPLLLSIFDPHSPGHDGAVIVEHGKLASFAARLPLSMTSTLSSAFGTRHHAALGLAEQTDALVLAVSEERGIVSIFSQGKMTRAHDPGEVAMRVLSHWRETGSLELAVQYRKGRRTLLWEVAVSLVAAILFWSTVVRERAEVLEMVLTVPIEYTQTPDNVVLWGEKPSQMQVHIAGPASELETLAPADLPVLVDLSHASPGRERFLVTAANLNLPKGVRLLDADPSAVSVVLKALQRTEVDVKPNLVGRLRQGLALTGVEVEPKTLQARAPAGEAGARVVTTEPIDLSTIRGSGSVTRKIVAPPTLQPAGGRWPDIKVTLAVEPEPVNPPAKK